MLSVDDLSITFGGLTALRGFTVDVAEREILALIGPNGAGKSTVFNIVTGLYRPSSGRVTFRGRDSMKTTAPAKDRAIEAAKAKARSAQRFGAEQRQG